jgi:hypothetical protein
MLFHGCARARQRLLRARKGWWFLRRKELESFRGRWLPSVRDEWRFAYLSYVLPLTEGIKVFWFFFSKKNILAFVCLADGAAGSRRPHCVRRRACR